MDENSPLKKPKSQHAEREEKILAFWKEKDVFAKSLQKNEGGKEFIFYEGPPTANGRPGIHHLEARAFKDAIPRYKTMRGFHVKRKGGWDTHGLPVELQVEKQLNLKSKKEIEEYGISEFNKKCKESVWEYVHEWENFTERIGYWIDLKNPYITYKPEYIESVWNILEGVEKQKLIYKDYKVVPWCPRCGTTLSSHELAQGYETVKDLSVYVKFKIKKVQKPVKDEHDEYFLAWTTTPWTLPGNVALAVNSKIDYVKIKVSTESKEEFYILAKERLSVLKDTKYEQVESIKGEKLVGLSYEPLYDFVSTNITGPEKDKLKHAFKVYAADFVTTEDGTGIVHTAVMYGQDDFELGTKVGLPKYHIVNEDGTFRLEAGFLQGRFVKDPDTDVEIIKDLAHRGLLFAKEKYEHSYPHCWRCHTPLIYYARDSWYIAMSSLRKKLVKENEHINWEPDHIKHGRFGEWLEEVKDWAISRERYWGTPLPIWVCEKCKKRKVVGSIAEIEKKPRNEYFLMRHGQAENNVASILNGDSSKKFKLTQKGREQVRENAEQFKIKPDLIFSSPLERAYETATIAAEVLDYPKEKIVIEDRLREMHFGQLEGAHQKEYYEMFQDDREYFKDEPKGIENHFSIRQRVSQFVEDLEKKYEGKKIMLVSHAAPIWMLASMGQGFDIEKTVAMKPHGKEYIQNAEIRQFTYHILPHNENFELDLHRPFIDTVKLTCSCGGSMSRIKEVLDVWFDSGAMPFAQHHYPFSVKKHSWFGSDDLPYPADFISEAIDQTRGWFYTLHAIGILTGKGNAYKNVICLGHILDKDGKKMSKSLGNAINPWDMMDKYGVDALRLWMYSVNQPGDSKNFDEKTIDELVKKVFNLISNVLSFYKLYEQKDKGNTAFITSANVLDQWILARLGQLVELTTNGLETYHFFEPTRALRDFAADLSQWYIRRSRDRFKGDDESDKEAAIQTTRHVLITLAKIMAPFTPFFAEYIYGELAGDKESVHIEDWPEAMKISKDSKLVIENMNKVRTFASKGLEARMKVKINVRQPLQTLKIKGEALTDSNLVQIIMDEVNVKEVIFDTNLKEEVELDTNISPELKEEGMVRELVRAIQDLRKEKGLSVSDKAILTIETDLVGQEFIRKHTDKIQKVTLLIEIKFSAAEGEFIEIGGTKFKLSI
jgi:isoleucyl-tRNA synthetase